MADCGDKGVVVMDHAVYGRMSLGRCLKNAFGYLGCDMDVLEHMDEKCSGRNRCDIRDIVDELHVHNPCEASDLKVYLQASYHCVTGGWVTLTGHAGSTWGCVPVYITYHDHRHYSWSVVQMHCSLMQRRPNIVSHQA